MKRAKDEPRKAPRRVTAVPQGRIDGAGAGRRVLSQPEADRLIGEHLARYGPNDRRM